MRISDRGSGASPGVLALEGGLAMDKARESLADGFRPFRVDGAEDFGDPEGIPVAQFDGHIQ